MAQYAVMRLGKIKTMGVVAGLEKHVERERTTRNADEQRWGENEPITGTVARTYDNGFRLASESVNGAGPIAYRYDADGLLTGAGGLSLSRDPANGRVAGSALGSITDTLGYGDYGDVTSYGASNGADSLFATSYARDALSRVAAVTETVAGASHTDAYTYDAAGRLTGVTRDGAMIGQYAYDANGNRTSVTESGGTTNAVYDARDRLLTNGTTTYTYTANGEVASQLAATGAMTSYVYDAFGNLTGATLPDGTRVTYSLDGTGRRIGVQVDGAPVQGFLYDDTFDNPVAELDGAGNVAARFVYATGSTVPYYMVKGGTTYRIISDHLGSPRLVVDASTGAVAQRMDYDAWGNVVGDTNPGFQPFGFAGGLYERHTGLTHFGAREYDAATGRWTSPDPLLFAGGGTNLYAYVLDDPVNHLDPSGEFIDPISIGFGALYGAETNVVGTLAAYSAQGKRPSLRQVFASAAGGAVGGAIGAFGGPLTNGLGNAIGQLVTNAICPNSGSVADAFIFGTTGAKAANKIFGESGLVRLGFARALAKRGGRLTPQGMARAVREATLFAPSQLVSGGISQLSNVAPSGLP